MYLNVNRHQAAHYMTVLLDGEDVSNQCVEADDSEGYVVLIAVNGAGGRIRIENGKLATERRTGEVVIIPREDAPVGRGSNTRLSGGSAGPDISRDPDLDGLPR